MMLPLPRHVSGRLTNHATILYHVLKTTWYVRWPKRIFDSKAKEDSGGNGSGSDSSEEEEEEREGEVEGSMNDQSKDSEKSEGENEEEKMKRKKQGMCTQCLNVNKQHVIHFNVFHIHDH